MGNLLLVAATLGVLLVFHDLLHGVLELVHLSLHLVVLVFQHDDVGSGSVDFSGVGNCYLGRRIQLDGVGGDPARHLLLHPDHGLTVVD